MDGRWKENEHRPGMADMVVDGFLIACEALVLNLQPDVITYEI